MYSKGISWIDDCRIPHNEEIMVAIDYQETKQSDNGWGTKNRILEPSNRGRFPANLLVSDDMLNDGVISKSVSGGKGKALPNSDGKNDGIRMRPETVKERGGFNDKGTNSRYYDIDKWFDKIIDV
jgi:hypothetical protein